MWGEIIYPFLNFNGCTKGQLREKCFRLMTSSRTADIVVHVVHISHVIIVSGSVQNAKMFGQPIWMLLMEKIEMSHTLRLTHLPLDKMATISQMILSDAFSLMKSFVFWLKCDWNLFLRVPTGDAPTASEWSTILMPTKVQLILDVWWYVLMLYI